VSGIAFSDAHAFPLVQFIEEMQNSALLFKVIAVSNQDILGLAFLLLRRD